MASASFSPQINIINSSAPIPEPTPDNTGKITWLEGQVQEPQEGEEAVFIIDYDLSLFRSLYINGQELTLNEDYTLEEGSTIITINANYISKLKIGDYNILAKYSDGKEFATVMRITENIENTDISTLAPDTGALNMQMFGGDLARNTPFILSGLFILLALFFLFKRYGINWLISRKQKRSPRMVENHYRPRITKMVSSTNLRSNSQSGLSINSRRIIPVILGLLIISGGVATATNLLSPQTNDQQVYAESSSDSGLSISTTDGNFEKDVDLSGGSAFVSTSQTVTIDTATAHGYKLFISTDSPEYNDLSINGSISADARISTSSNTFTSPDVLEEDSYGFAVDNSTFGTDYTPSSTSKWAGIPALGSETTIKETTNSTPANDSTTVYYGFNITNNLPDGSYYGTNNNTIIYKAIATILPTYDISYTCNGGSGSVESQTKETGASITISESTGCTNQGYHFKEWNTLSDGSGEVYSPGSTYSKDENLNLYAIWEADIVQTYRISYSCNGGNGTIDDQFKLQSTNIELSDGSTCSLTGSNIIKWNTKSDGSGNDYSLGANYSTDADLSLYAVWETLPVEEHTFTLNYNANGGTGAPSAQTNKTTNNSTTFSISSTKPTRTGYNFKGWSTNKNATTGAYQAGGSITVTNISTTLYAIWEVIPSKTFILYYSANGGANAPAQQSITTTASSAQFTISQTIPTRTNYAFKGWCTVATSNGACTGTTYQKGNTITLSSSTSVTLYAMWIYNGPVQVSSITISGTNSILVNAQNHTSQLSAAVAPSNATNKAVTWTSSNSAVATVSSTGLVTAVDAGTTVITATAKDGSGKKATYNITVRKKVIILLGASQLERINGASYANIKSYSSTKSKNSYTTTQNNQYAINREGPKKLNETLNFIYFPGRGYNFETSENWGKDAAILQQTNPAYSGWSFAKKIVHNYKTRMPYVDFHIYFTLLGNDIKYYSCTDAENDKNMEYTSDSRHIILPTVTKQVVRYNTDIVELTKEGYNVQGYVTSVQPVRASQSESTKIVNSNHKNSCDAKYRSNIKYYKYGKKVKSIISSKNYTSIKYVDTLSQILDTKETSTGWGWNANWKATWGEYNTSDGIHWTNATAGNYLKFWLGLNGNL